VIEERLPDEWRVRDRALIALIKIPSILADLLTAWLIARGLSKVTPGLRLLGAALYTFHPAVWYLSAMWGQADSVFTFFLVASVVSLERNAILPTWLSFALAVGTKVQSIVVAPLLVVVTFVRHRIRGLLAAFAASLGVVAVLAVPWIIDGRLADVLLAPIRLPNNTPVVDKSAYNLWYLLLGGQIQDVSSALHPLGLPFSYQQIGLTIFALFVALVVALAWRQNGLALALPIAVLYLGFYTLPTEVHERYTIVPFTKDLGINLLTTQGTTPDVMIARGLSFVAAVVNIAMLVWLTVELAAISKRSSVSDTISAPFVRES
jgi:Gpi18-like mannosyltransferase